jgi:hypothetical protein
MAIDYNELEKALRNMNERQKLFQIVKSEMLRRGHWKNLPRGKAITENLKRK